MELERSTHHRQPTTTPSTASDLFICFTSRLTNSSSMRLSNPPKPSSSIHSPGHSSDNPHKPPISSLSASLSRRLRSRNGSLRGAQSPMFPPGAVKKKGCSTFDNPEPSSPKVTCIGQVRVKTKKQGKKMKMNMRACRSKRRSGSRGGGASVEPSFRQSRSRRVQQQQEEREANAGCLHLPISICDAFKVFDCLIPCKSSCCGERDTASRNNHNSTGSSSSCGGAVFRWLVALHDGGDHNKARDIELVRGGQEENRGAEGVVMERECSRRRSIFDDMDFQQTPGGGDDYLSKQGESGNGEKGDEIESAARESICVPPKNALLLMRCRSDPVKMAALANRFWESPVRKGEESEDEEEEGGMRFKRKLVVERHRLSVGKDAKVHDVEMIEKGKDIMRRRKVKSVPTSPGDEQEEEKFGCEIAKSAAEVKMEEEELLGELVLRLFDVYFLEQLKLNGGIPTTEEEEEEEEEEASSVESQLTGNQKLKGGIPTEEASSVASQLIGNQKLNGGIPTEEASSVESQLIGNQKVEFFDKEIGPHRRLLAASKNDQLQEQKKRSQDSTPSSSSSDSEEEDQDTKLKPNAAAEQQNQVAAVETERKSASAASGGLPDCLLLMMCEPKLSMEVSKETWVRTTDFIRWLPERHRQHHLNKVKPMEDDNKGTNKPTTTTANTTTTALVKEEQNPNPKKKTSRPPKFPLESDGKVVVLPGRSSCSFPAGVATGPRKVGGGGGRGRGGGSGYEPPGLTRCKSAPMRSATAKLTGAAAAAAAKQGDLTAAACAWKNRRMEPHRPATCGVGGGF